MLGLKKMHLVVSRAVSSVRLPGGLSSHPRTQAAGPPVIFEVTEAGGWVQLPGE